VGLMTIFSSLFVASYDSQGYGGGIRPRLHSGRISTEVKVMLRPTVQSASLSWNKAPIWGLRPDLYYCQTVAGLLKDLHCTTSPRYIAPARTAQKTSITLLRVLVTGETCPQSCSLATAVVLSPVYKAVTWRWVYMSQYSLA
jgi:hypothetical protein